MIRLFVHLMLFWVCSGVVNAVDFSEQERRLILLHGPWSQNLPQDSSNLASGDNTAIRFGEMLFFDNRLDIESRFSCASCHDPDQAFTDGLETGQGRLKLQRNTPTLLNLKTNRWFGWGGESDSLWAQSIRPLVAENEMASNAQRVKDLLLTEKRYQRYYQQVFSEKVDVSDNQILLVNVAKALAAYQETLVSERSAFDNFRDALSVDDQSAMQQYPESAQRGLKIFIGAGRCNLCHFGANFTNGEFGDIGIGYFTEDGVDAGRYRGIQQLRKSPYNLSSQYNDGVASENAISSQQVRLTHRSWGEFKVPGLRDVSKTAPYMHNGSLATLRDVVRHYSEIDEERLHSDGEKILRPLNLSEGQIDDLVSFLESLSKQE